MDKKQHQPALNVEQQIENLKSLNLIIKDEKNAKKVLSNISYFRIIKAYGLGLKQKNSQFDGTVQFDDIVALYHFNEHFRQLLFRYIERIEVNLRCRIANYFSCTYGVLGYENAENFSVPEYHEEFLRDIKSEINRNSRTPFVKNFRNNYIDGKIPFYALVELFSFGTLSKFFKNMKATDKKAIAELYGINYTYLESWFEHIAFVRNICAHYGRIYNVNLSKTPKLYKQYSESNISNLRVFATLICMKHLLTDDTEWEEFVNAVENLIIQNPQVKIELMGFPNNWKKYLIS